MSDAGRLRRGKKWYDFRDIKGKLPEDITKDEFKMCDVNFYLESLAAGKKEEEGKKTKSKKER